jgi:hypothetical protein
MNPARKPFPLGRPVAKLMEDSRLGKPYPRTDQSIYSAAALKGSIFPFLLDSLRRQP